MANLFYSESAQNILAILCQKPNEQYHINDLIRKTGRYPYSIQTALKKLENLNLVVSNKKFYQINKENSIYPEIRTIFAKLGLLVDIKLAPLLEEISWVKTVNRLTALTYHTSSAQGLDKPMRVLFGFPFKYYWVNGVTGGVYYNKLELERATQRIGQIVKNPDETRKLLTAFEKWISDSLTQAQILKKVGEKTQPKISNKKLAIYISNFNKSYANIAPLYVVPYVMEKALFSDIKSSLELILSVRGKARKLSHYLDLLTSPDPDIEERIEALKIAAHIKNKGFDKKTQEFLSTHAKKFSFLTMYFLTDTPLTTNDFMEEIKTLLRKYHSPKRELDRIKEENKIKKQRLEKFFKEFRPSRLFQEKVKLFREISNLRTKRAYVDSKVNFYFKPLYCQILKRMNVPKKYQFYITIDELCQYLQKGIKPTTLTLQKRNQGWAILVWKGRLRLITGIKEIVETMERLKIVPETLRGIYAPAETNKDKNHPRQIKEFTGISVYKGVVKGRVKIIKNNNDCHKIKIGDIFVSQVATPAYLPGLYKSSGMIINEGGLTSHAALYAKALKIPTLIQTEIATDVLKDNDIVELNATKGIVTKN